VNSGGEWFFDEYARGTGVRSLGLEVDPANADPAAPQALPPADEKKRILDLFKN
jgi:penicillin-binding protein 1A